jgi:hypothetical protein
MRFWQFSLSAQSVWRSKLITRLISLHLTNA